MISIHNSNVQDTETQGFLAQLNADEQVRANRVVGVKDILVIMSSRGVVFDDESLKQKILLTYPSAKVYFMSTLGIPMGEKPPQKIDLLIDFTGPGQRHKWLLARKLRSRTRVCVGRTAGLFREFIYDRIFDETKVHLPKDLLEKERFVQKTVLELAGVPLSQKGTPGEDQGKTIASHKRH